MYTLQQKQRPQGSRAVVAWRASEKRKKKNLAAEAVATGNKSCGGHDLHAHLALHPLLHLENLLGDPRHLVVQRSQLLAVPKP